MNTHDELNQKFKSFATKYKLFNSDKKFVLLFSGGKDCTFLLDMILNNFTEIKSKLEIFCVKYPHHVYIDKSGKETSTFKKVKRYWKNNGLEINYLNSPEPEFDYDDRQGCKICKKSRKLLIDPYVDTLQSGSRLLVGLTLYDVLAYYNTLLLSLDLNLKNFNNDTITQNMKSSLIKMLHKIKPIEKLPSEKIMIRPLLSFNEIQIKEYLEAKKIPYITTPCKIGEYKLKRKYFDVLNIWLDTDDLPKYETVVKMLEEHGILLDELPFDDMENDSYFIDC